MAGRAGLRELDDLLALMPRKVEFSNGTATLSLRGVLVRENCGREYTCVMVERGDTMSIRRNLLAARWGLSHREMEVLTYVAMGKTNAEIGILLGAQFLDH